MGELVKELYTATVTVTGGRRGGVARSSDGILDLALEAPVETGGPGGATNPEQLFAAGYAACYTSALGVVARRRHLDLGQTEVTARVVLGQEQSQVYGLRVELSVRCTTLAVATLREVAQAAHEVCPFSRAIQGNIEVALLIATELDQEFDLDRRAAPAAGSPAPNTAPDRADRRRPPAQ